MTDQPTDKPLKYGQFPFPLTGSSNESRFLTWLRNHSNYMAVGGFLDYLRMAAVLLRGIFINNLMLLPPLLVAALALSLVYGGMLTDWDDQRTPDVQERRDIREKQPAPVHAVRPTLAEVLSALKWKLLSSTEPPDEKSRREVYEAQEARDLAEKANVPVSFFLTKEAHFESGWAKWMQDRLGLTPLFLLTPLVLALAAVWGLLFPVVTMLTKIAGYQKSLASGSDSSVQLRNWYERTFAIALLLVLGVALFELLPRLVYLYNQVRIRHYAAGVPWREYLTAAAAAVGSLSAAPKLLSMLGGVWRKLAMAVIALGGVLAPLLVIVVVSDFLIFEPVPLTHRNLVNLALLLTVTPGIYALGIVSAMLIGFFKRTFTRREYRRLSTMLVGMIAIHIVMIAAMCATYFLVFFLYQDHPTAVPDILLAVEGLRGNSLEFYGDMAAYFVLAAAFEIWVFGWLTVDINQTSIHGLYRDRLASAYLLGVSARGEVDIEEDVPLGELSVHATGSTAPYHLINVALNLQGSKDIGLRDRHSDFFIFSKKFIGGERTGYCRSGTMEQVFPQVNLASAMAISAAAASPNMGRSTSPALVAFMTLINVRLGVWVPNPGLLEEDLARRTARRDSAKRRLAGRRAKRRAVKQGIDEGDRRKAPGFGFDDVFADELASVQKRWQQLDDQGAGRSLADDRTPKVAHALAGIAFSGGGIRSATLNLGIAQALHRAGLFRHFDYMSTVSGGGYVGASISTLMRYKTLPVSEIVGSATVETAPDGSKIVRVAGRAGEARIYRYSREADVLVRNGDAVRSGQRLIGRTGARLRSEIGGAVKVETMDGGQQVVTVTDRKRGEERVYRYTKYDRLAVRNGSAIRAGRLLVKLENSFGDRFRWRVRPKALLLEMTMRLDENHRWVNLSDGGHIENLAAIELLRRRCKFIVIGDGEADPKMHFYGLATLIRTARIDLGIDIDIHLDELRLDADRSSRSHLAIGRITYPGDRERGYLLYMKSSFTGDEDEVIGEYRHRSPDFPHESTADQFFNEGQFEAYRALGQHIGEQAVEALALSRPAAGSVTFAEFSGGFQAFWQREHEERMAPPGPPGIS